MLVNIISEANSVLLITSNEKCSSFSRAGR